jgi:hypothetical protein
MVVVAQSNRKVWSPPRVMLGPGEILLGRRKQIGRHRFRPKDRRIITHHRISVEILASTQTPYALNLFQLLMRPGLMAIQLEMASF